MTTTRPKSTSPVPSKGDDKNGTPSGFVLKLYQMVNGAPDDIVSVSAPICSLICLSWEGSGFAPFEGCASIFSPLGMRATTWIILDVVNNDRRFMRLPRTRDVLCHCMLCPHVLWGSSIFRIGSSLSEM